MNARKLALAVLAAMCTLVGVGATAPAAGATTVHPRLYESAPFSQSSAFARPTGVAVDPETGNVYLSDAPNERVDVFGVEGGSPAAGVPARVAGVEFGSSGEPEAVAVDSSCYYHHLTGSACESFDPSNGDVYVAESAKEAIAKYRLNKLSDEYELAETLKVSGEPNGVAVDTAGDVYVAIFGDKTILEFSLAGAEIGKIKQHVVNNPGFVAVGAPGVVYVGNYNGGVARLEVSSSDKIEHTAELAGSETGKAVALDSQGDAYVDTESSILEYDSSGAPIEEFGAGAFKSSEGIAVAPGTGDVYVSNGETQSITVFGPAVRLPTVTTGSATEVTQTSAVLNGSVNPEASSITSCIFEYGTSVSYGQSAPCVPAPGSGTSPVAVSVDLQGLGHGTTYHYRLVVVTGQGVSRGTDATITTAGPRIDGESATAVAASSATLNALIDPVGQAATYHFEYDTASYSSGAPHGTSVPVPDGSTGPGTSDVLVSVAAQGLVPDTTYHYRVLASNEQGETVDGHEGTFTTLPSSCPNEAARTGFDALLPECRAYELVSPAGTAPQIELNTKSDNASDISRGARIQGKPEGVNVSASGEKIAFRSNYAPSNSPSDSQYFMASRGAQGWSTASLAPPQTPEYTILCHNAYAVAYSTELTNWVLGDGWGQAESRHGLEGCGKDEPELVQGEPQDFQNLFVSGGLSAPYQLIDVTLDHVQPDDAWFQAASSNLEHVVFDEHAKLTPEAPEGDDFYIWSGGASPAVRLLTILPNGTATTGALVNRDEDEKNGEGPSDGEDFFRHGPEIYTHAVSSNASRVFFHTGGKLYARENAYAQQSALAGESCTEAEKACTVQLDASQAGGAGGGGQFMWASADGSRVFFTDTERLTSNSTAAAGKPDLYEYDFEAPEGARLTDLTVNTVNTSEPANVLGVSGTAANGSYIYLVAEGKLTSEANSNGDSAVAGRPNLYVAHAGELDFVATLDPAEDNMDWDVKVLTTRVSENGRYIAFDSQRQLTGYDNTPAAPADCTGSAQSLCTEIFLYDAQERQLSCVSCEPNGAQPTAPAEIEEPEDRVMDNNSLSEQNAPGYLQHNVTDQGQVFFSTAEPLTQLATNGLENAYEYRDGEVRLLSTATSNTGAYFYEASASGDDVFITTNQPLTQGAEGSEYAIYDVRVDGGFPPAEPATACSEEDCRGAIVPTPLLGAPSSQTLVATGNPAASSTAPKVTTKHVKPKPKKKKKKHKTKGAKGKGRSKGKKALDSRRAVRNDHGGVR